MGIFDIIIDYTNKKVRNSLISFLGFFLLTGRSF